MNDFEQRDYVLSTTLSSISFETAEALTRSALSAQGFGVLTTIDVAATMKKKLGRLMPRYVILGACSPSHAWEALQKVPSVGVFLPCNVVVVENADDTITIGAVNAEVMFSLIDPSLKSVAAEVTAGLAAAIEDVKSKAEA